MIRSSRLSLRFSAGYKSIATTCTVKLDTLQSLLYVKMGRVTVFSAYAVQGMSQYLEHKLQQDGLWHQTLPLPPKQCFAKLPSIILYYIHVQHKSLHITASVVKKKKNWFKFSVSAMFTLLPLPNLDYVICRWNCGTTYTCNSTDILWEFVTYSKYCSSVLYSCQDYILNESWVENMLIEMGRRSDW